MTRKTAPKKVAKPAKPKKIAKVKKVVVDKNQATLMPSEQTKQVEPKVESQNFTITLPVFEGAQVIAILEEDVNGTFKHCKMSDGTTRHVPNHLF